MGCHRNGLMMIEGRYSSEDPQKNTDNKGSHTPLSFMARSASSWDRLADARRARVLGASPSRTAVRRTIRRKVPSTASYTYQGSAPRSRPVPAGVVVPRMNVMSINTEHRGEKPHFCASGGKHSRSQRSVADSPPPPPLRDRTLVERSQSVCGSPTTTQGLKELSREIVRPIRCAGRHGTDSCICLVVSIDGRPCTEATP